MARFIRGTLCGVPVVVLGGLVEGDYVGATKGMSLFVPGLVGLGCAAAVSRGAAPLRTLAITLVGAVFGAVAAALGFWSAAEPYGPINRWLPPVIAGAAGAVVWAWYDKPAQRSPTSR